jgi:hypothetical protein
MGLNEISLKTIKSKIKANNKVKICLSVDSLRKIISNNQNKTIKLYVDEFMFSHAFCRQFFEVLEIFPELITTRIFFFINQFFTKFINI